MGKGGSPEREVEFEDVSDASWDEIDSLGYGDVSVDVLEPSEDADLYEPWGGIFSKEPEETPPMSEEEFAQAEREAIQETEREAEPPIGTWGAEES